MATASHAVAVDPKGDYPEPYKEQIPFMGTDRRFYGFISGTGAGKTFAGVYRMLVNATIWNPNSMGAIIVPDKSQFIDNVKPIMEDFGLMDRWEYKSVYTDEPGLKTSNGERILILSADNQRQIGRIKGKNLAYVWMDEEAEIDPRAREIAQQRLRVGNYPNLFITTTPDGYNHTYEFFKEEVDVTDRPIGEHGGQIYEAEDRLAIIGVPPEANPVMREEDIASMRASLPDQIVAQEIEGRFIEIGGGLFQRDMLTFISEAELEEIGEERNFNFVVGVDVGVEADAQKARDTDSDYWAAALLMVNEFDGEAYLIDVKRERGLSLNQGVAWLQNVVKELPKNAPVYVESNQSQRWFKQELANAGVNAIAEVNTRDKEERIVQLSVPLENDTIRLLNRDVDEQLGYDPRWQAWIQEILSFPDGSHDDMIDATELAVRKANVGTSVRSILGADPYGGEE